MGLPDLEAGEYLLEALFEVGPVRMVAEGELPLGWAEVWAYAQATGAVEEAWEARALISMSRGYLGAKNAGKNPLAIPPVERSAPAPSLAE